MAKTPPKAKPASKTESADPPVQRIFLVVVDETKEMRVALHFAALRARHTGGRVALLSVIEPSDELSLSGAVEDLQRQEARAAAEELLAKLSSEVKDISGSLPVVYIREGHASDALLALLGEEPSISVLVLAAGTGSDGPGPLVSALIGKMAGSVRVPITVVPGSLSDAQLAALA